MLAGKADPLHFVQAIALLTQLVSEVADHRRRLVTDLASGECFRNHGQRFQLLADTKPVGRRRHRHAADAADPGSGADVSAYEVIAGSLDLANLASELHFKRVDAGPQAFGVYPALIPSLKLADRRQQFREGCDPFPSHDPRVPNICLGVNTLTQKKHFKTTCFCRPIPTPTPCSQSFRSVGY